MLRRRLSSVHDSGQNCREYFVSGWLKVGNRSHLVWYRFYEDKLVSWRDLSNSVRPYFQERVVEVAIPVNLRKGYQFSPMTCYEIDHPPSFRCWGPSRNSFLAAQFLPVYSSPSPIHHVVPTDTCLLWAHLLAMLSFQRG